MKERRRLPLDKLLKWAWTDCIAQGGYMEDAETISYCYVLSHPDVMPMLPELLCIFLTGSFPGSWYLFCDPCFWMGRRKICLWRREQRKTSPIPWRKLLWKQNTHWLETTWTYRLPFSSPGSVWEEESDHLYVVIVGIKGETACP